MKIQTVTLKELIKAVGADPEALAQAIIEHQELLNEAAMIEDRFRQIRKAEKELCDEQKEFRQRCKHYLTTYHPDPSGNSDSYRSCNVCGKTL